MVKVISLNFPTIFASMNRSWRPSNGSTLTFFSSLSPIFQLYSEVTLLYLPFKLTEQIFECLSSLH